MGVQDVSKYAEVKTLFGVPQDEPLFILRAQDRLAVPTIACYDAAFGFAAMASGKTLHDPDTVRHFSDHLWAVIENFRRWSQRNPDTMKLPD